MHQPTDTIVPTRHAPRRNPLRHAIVIGSGMAGLLAARVLADYVDQVTVLERDHLPATPATRAGVPQGRHAHLLLLRGLQIMEDLLPGLEADLTASGAVAFDWVDDMLWFNLAGAKLRFPSDLRSHICSRELLEWVVRRRVASHPAITLLDGCQVTGLRPDVTGRCIVGVTARRTLAGNCSQDLVLDADLVVDAGGRNSRAPQWLETLGYEAPQETRIDAQVGYASRIYRMPASGPAWKALYLQGATTEQTRGGVILPLEGERWMVTLTGVGGDYPPAEERGFMDFARSLPNPLLFHAISDAEALSAIHGFRGLDNRRRHYESLVRRPEQFVVLGDAACSFNPVYGQGMTAAALSAQALDRCLREQRRRRHDESLEGFAARFQQRLAHAVAAPWSLSTSQDLQLPHTGGGRPSLIANLLQRYVDGATALAAKRPDADLTLRRVLHLLAPPVALFHPRIAVPVLGHILTRRLGEATRHDRRIRSFRPKGYEAGEYPHPPAHDAQDQDPIPPHPAAQRRAG